MADAVSEYSSPEYLGDPSASTRFNHDPPSNVHPRFTSDDLGVSLIRRNQTSSSIISHHYTIGHHRSYNCRSMVNALQPPSTPVSLLVPHPQNLAPIPNDVGFTISLILLQYERMVDRSYARPSYDLFGRVREHTKRRIQSSNTIRVPALLACKVFESLDDGTGKQKSAHHNRCIARLEQHLFSGLDKDINVVESYGRHAGILEMTLLKLMLTGGVDTYKLLRHTAPNFVQVASADLSMWTKPFDCASLSLAHVISSTQYQLARFVLLDSVCSMVYTLPQVVEYNTSTPPLPSDLNTTEWIQGCAAEFQFALVQINQDCNSLNRIGPETDWRPIEDRIKTWQPKARAAPDKQSWKSVARLAVQESWRHALLIYLYMAAGGVTSDDARVCACVQQVFRLARIVEQVEVESTDAPLHVQYLIAGIYSPYEHHRARTELRLSRPGLGGMWFIHGPEFVPVLNHLWCGVAADGRAIRWSDYAHSRQTMLPIVC